MNILVDENQKKSFLTDRKGSESNINIIFQDHQKSSSELIHIKKCLEKHFIFYNLSDQ